MDLRRLIMINFAERINKKHKGTQRKYDCVYYNHSNNKNERCSIIYGEYPITKQYYAECELENDCHCPFFKKGC